jgi:hypothetical protein
MGVDTKVKAMLVQLLTSGGCLLRDESQMWHHPTMRPPRTYYSDCLVRFQRMSHSKRFRNKLIDSTELFNSVFRWYVHRLAHAKLKRLGLIFDKGSSPDKLQEGKKRAGQEAKANAKDDAEAEEDEFAFPDDGEGEEEAKVDPTSSVPVVPVAIVRYGPSHHFANGAMLTTAWDATRQMEIVESQTTLINFTSLMSRDAAHLRYEFILWFSDMVVRHSHRFPEVEFLIDFTFDRSKGPLIIQNGTKRIALEFANPYHEADHAIAALANITPSEHYVSGTIDGDHFLIQLYQVYAQRLRAGWYPRESGIPCNQAHDNSGYWLAPGELCGPNQWNGTENATERHVVFVWESPTPGEDLIIDMNAACSYLINAKQPPIQWAMLFAMQKCDYLQKSHLLRDAGPEPLRTMLKANASDLDGFEELSLDEATRRMRHYISQIAKAKANTNEATFSNAVHSVQWTIRKWKNCGVVGHEWSSRTKLPDRHSFQPPPRESPPVDEKKAHTTRVITITKPHSAAPPQLVTVPLAAAPAAPEPASSKRKSSAPEAAQKKRMRVVRKPTFSIKERHAKGEMILERFPRPVEAPSAAVAISPVRVEAPSSSYAFPVPDDLF